MSVPDISALFDVLQVKRTELLGDTKAWIGAFFKSPDRSPSDRWDDTTDESAPVDWWQQYGFVSRPPEGTESLLLRAGANCFAIASRVLTAAGIFGQLAEGDVALFSLGKNVIKLGVDGSISIMRTTKSGDTLIVSFGTDDSIKGVIPNGPWFEMSKANGVTINAGTQPLTLASAQSVQIVAPQLINSCGVVKLHVAAVAPLVHGVGGTIPVPNVFV